MPTLATGKTAPPFDLTGMDGRKYSLQAALRRGPVLAAFFKVSCPTCQFTLPFIERLYQQFRSAGAQFLGISQDNAENSKLFAKQFGVTFPILIDDEPYETSREYGLKYVPTLFLVAPGGHVEVSGEGFCKADLLEIQKSLAKHYSTQPPALFEAKDRVPEYKPG